MKEAVPAEIMIMTQFFRTTVPALAAAVRHVVMKEK